MIYIIYLIYIYDRVVWYEDVLLVELQYRRVCALTIVSMVQNLYVKSNQLIRKQFASLYAFKNETIAWRYNL